MPSAPAVPSEDAADLFAHPHNGLSGGASPYMMFAFDMTPKAEAQMPAALHRADKTART